MRHALPLVDHESDVDVAPIVNCRLDPDAVDLFARRSGLLGNKAHADQYLGRVPDRAGCRGELDAAGQPASTGVDLRLDGEFLAGDRPCAVFGLDRAARQGPLGDGHPILSQYLLGLILWQIHRRPLASGRRCPSRDQRRLGIWYTKCHERSTADPDTRKDGRLHPLPSRKTHANDRHINTVAARAGFHVSQNAGPLHGCLGKEAVLIDMRGQPQRMLTDKLRGQFAIARLKGVNDLHVL